MEWWRGRLAWWRRPAPVEATPGPVRLAQTVNVTGHVGNLVQVGTVHGGITIKSNMWDDVELEALVAGRVDEVDPLLLGVHAAVSPSGSAAPDASLPPYFERPHDVLLRNAIRAVVAGGPSVLAVLVGDSSTGKTRALFEAVRQACPHRFLLCPANPAELLAILDQVEPTSAVIWLNELQRYLYGEAGEIAAGRLQRLLTRTDGIVAVGALWRDPYFTELMAVGRQPDLQAAARALLTGARTRRIPVPDHLTQAQRQALAQITGDPRVAVALASATADGRVIQRLTGGPELLDGYLAGGLLTPVEQALVTAALDARRLGHLTPVPIELLTVAADGYLTARQRPGDPAWASTALTALTTGERGDGTRTDIRHVLTPLFAVRPSSGRAEVGYVPEDYLDQRIRVLRQADHGPAELWHALATHTTDPDDLQRLAEHALVRGLYRHASGLWTRAVAAGNTGSAGWLLRFLHDLGREDQSAASWVAAHVALKDTEEVSVLLYHLRSPEFEDALSTLTDRIATGIPLTDPGVVAEMLSQLHLAGAHEAVTVLLDRHPADHVTLEKPYAIGELLVSLVEVGAPTQLAALLARDPAHFLPLDDPGDVAWLLRALIRCGARGAVTALLARDPVRVVTIAPDGVAALIQALREAGDDAAMNILASRAAASTPLTDLSDVCTLLECLHIIEAAQAVDVLAQRIAADAPVNDPLQVSFALESLGRTGANAAQTTLAERAAHDVPLDDIGISSLLRALDDLGLSESLGILLDRDPISHVDEPYHADLMLQALRRIGARTAMTDLARRAAEHVAVESLVGVHYLLTRFRKLRMISEARIVARRVAEQTTFTDSLDYDPRPDAHNILDDLLEALRAVGAEEQANALLRRAADAGLFYGVIRTCVPQQLDRWRHGREFDGTPSAPWTWTPAPS